MALGVRSPEEAGAGAGSYCSFPGGSLGEPRLVASELSRRRFSAPPPPAVCSRRPSAAGWDAGSVASSREPSPRSYSTASRSSVCHSALSSTAASAASAARRARSALRETALGRLREELLRLQSNFAQAWRVILDKDRRGFLTCKDFCDACRGIGYRSNVRDAWAELDADGYGKVTICELDFATAETLGRLYSGLIEKYGSVSKAAPRLGVAGGRRLQQKAFCRRLLAERLARPDEAAALFDMLCVSKANTSVAAVGIRDLEWLALVGPMLPRPAVARVAPGSLAKEGFDDAASLSHEAGGAGCEDWDDGYTSQEEDEDTEFEAGGGGLDDESIVSESYLQEDLETEEDVYDKLYRNAQSRHQRLEIWEALLAKKSAKPPPRQTPELFNRLHNDADARKASLEMAAEDRFNELCPQPKPAQHDPEAFERLVRAKVLREPLDERAPERRSSTDGSRRAERLYEDGKRRLERAEMRRAVATMEEEEELQALQRKPAANVATKAGGTNRVVNRLYNNDMERRRRKDENIRQCKEDEERKELEERRAKNAVPANPQTFSRLYHDAAAKQRILDEKRREHEEEELRKLRQESIHTRAVGGGAVFDRLHKSYNKHRRPQDGEEETEYSTSFFEVEEEEGDGTIEEDVPSRRQQQRAAPQHFVPEPRWSSQQVAVAAGGRAWDEGHVPNAGSLANAWEDASTTASSCGHGSHVRPAARRVRDHEEPALDDAVVLSAEERVSRALALKAQRKVTDIEQALADVQAQSRALTATNLRSCGAAKASTVRPAARPAQAARPRPRNPTMRPGFKEVCSPRSPSAVQEPAEDLGPELPGTTRYMFQAGSPCGGGGAAPAAAAAARLRTPPRGGGGGGRGCRDDDDAEADVEPPRSRSFLVEFLRSVGKTETAALLEQQQT